MDAGDTSVARRAVPKTKKAGGYRSGSSVARGDRCLLAADGGAEALDDRRVGRTAEGVAP